MIFYMADYTQTIQLWWNSFLLKLNAKIDLHNARREVTSKQTVKDTR